MESSNGAIAVFGGTFNPVHLGHLRSARQLRQELGFAEVRFVPAARPPHRDEPDVSAEHRAAMVELAVADEAGLTCDRRELQRDAPSYTYDTLASLRAEVGPRQPLALVMGCDAVLGLPGWYRWGELLNLAHVIVIARPGWEVPAEGEVSSWLRQYGSSAAALREKAAGAVVRRVLDPQDISSTAIRALLQSGQSARGLVPDAVLAYIRKHALYTRRSKE